MARIIFRRRSDDDPYLPIYPPVPIGMGWDESPRCPHRIAISGGLGSYSQCTRIRNHEGHHMVTRGHGREARLIWKRCRRG